VSDATGEFEVVHRSRRYLLVAGDDFYGVWDLDGEDEDAIERFPGTDEGLDQAEARFHELRRLDRVRRWVSLRVLGIVFAVSAVLWIVGGIGLAVGFVGEPPFGLFQAAVIVNEVGFHLGVGALAVLAAVVLLRMARRMEETGTQQRGGRPDGLSPPWQGVLGTVILGAGSLGLAVWVVSAIVSLFLPTGGVVPLPGDSSFVEFVDGRPSRASQIAEAAGTVGFRVWVSAFVLLLIGWGRALRRRSSEGDADSN
jgi:hypothetical protein